MKQHKGEKKEEQYGNKDDNDKIMKKVAMIAVVMTVMMIAVVMTMMRVKRNISTLSLSSEEFLQIKRRK